MASDSALASRFFQAILLATPTSTSRRSFWALGPPNFPVDIVLHPPSHSLSLNFHRITILVTASIQSLNVP
jgi:hypothetical protein